MSTQDIPSIDDTITSLVVVLRPDPPINLLSLIQAGRICGVKKFNIDAEGAEDVAQQTKDTMHEYYSYFGSGKNGWWFDSEKLTKDCLEHEKEEAVIAIVSFPNDCSYINSVLDYLEDEGFLITINPGDYEVRS